MSITALIGIGIMIVAAYVGFKTHRPGPTLSVLLVGIIIFLAGNPSFLQSGADMLGDLLLRVMEAITNAAKNGK